MVDIVKLTQFGKRIVDEFALGIDFVQLFDRGRQTGLPRRNPFKKIAGKRQCSIGLIFGMLRITVPAFDGNDAVAGETDLHITLEGSLKALGALF